MLLSPSSGPLRGGSAALLLLVLASAPAAAQTDPFEAHLRWVHTPGAESWIPRSLEFAADGDLLWGAGSVGVPRLMLLASNELPDTTGGAALIDEDASLSAAVGTVLVRAGGDPGALFSMHQTLDAVAPVRHTHLARRAAGPGGALTTAWTHDLSLVGNGAPALAINAAGTHLVAAVSDANTGQLCIEWLDAAGGTLLAAETRTGGILRALELTESGDRVALLSGAELLVLDLSGGVVHQESLALSTNALAFSALGDRLAVGDGTSARVLDWDGVGYTESFRTSIHAGEAVTRAALSEDGAVLALGWWNQVTGTGVRFQVWDLATGSLAWEQVQSTPGSALQNFPEAVAVTPDGRRAAFGAWGTGDAAPEVLLVDVPSGAIVVQHDLPGSVRALALDPTGTRVAVGLKHAHANQFATTGEVRLYDSGERDLQVLGSPVSSTLRLATRAAGASRNLFVFGTAASTPKPFAGAIGSLWIQRGLPLRVFNRAADATGRSDLTVDVGRVANRVGWPFAVQGAARVSGSLRFTTTLLRPLGL